MYKSAGLVIIKNNKILLGHPTNGAWISSYTIPKGEIEDGENMVQAAIRETFEEVGIILPEERIPKEYHTIEYKDKTGSVYKEVYYFIVNVKDNEYPDILPKDQLQEAEIDWAGFLPLKEAEKKIFWRFKSILKNLQ